MEPYQPIPGRVPRKVELDRLKKEYKAFNITELLKAEVTKIPFSKNKTFFFRREKSFFLPHKKHFSEIK
jgi:hypothetical protein